MGNEGGGSTYKPYIDPKFPIIWLFHDFYSIYLFIYFWRVGIETVKKIAKWEYALSFLPFVPSGPSRAGMPRHGSPCPCRAGPPTFHVHSEAVMGYRSN